MKTSIFYYCKKEKDSEANKSENDRAPQNIHVHHFVISITALLHNLKRKMSFPDGSVVKNPPANAGDMGSTSGMGRSPGEGNGNPSIVLPGKSHGQRSLGAAIHGVTRVEHGLALHNNNNFNK